MGDVKLNEGFSVKKMMLKAAVAAALVLTGALVAAPPDQVASWLAFIHDPWVRTIIVTALVAGGRSLNNWLKNKDK